MSAAAATRATKNGLIGDGPGYGGISQYAVHRSVCPENMSRSRILPDARAIAGKQRGRHQDCGIFLQFRLQHENRLHGPSARLARATSLPPQMRHHRQTCRPAGGTRDGLGCPWPTDLPSRRDQHSDDGPPTPANRLHQRRQSRRPGRRCSPVSPVFRGRTRRPSPGRRRFSRGLCRQPRPGRGVRRRPRLRSSPPRGRSRRL